MTEGYLDGMTEASEKPGAATRRRRTEAVVTEAGRRGNGRCFHAVDKGLYLATYFGGSGTWFTLDDGKGKARRRVPIGHYPEMDCEAAYQAMEEIRRDGLAFRMKRIRKDEDMEFVRLTTIVTRGMRADITDAAKRRDVLFRDYVYNLLRIGFRALEGRETR